MTFPRIPRGARSVRIRFFAALTLAIGACLGVAVASSHAAVETAPSASSYRDSIGVQTHLDFGGYAYEQSSIDDLSELIRGIGVRHLRDHACMNVDAVCATVRARLGELGGALGPGRPRVGLLLGVMPLVNNPTDRAERDEMMLRALRGVRDSPLADLAEGLEMVNEPDIKNPAWAAQTVADAETLRRLLALPEFAALRHIPVLAPALGRQAETSDLLAAGWNPDWADIPNLHPYPPTYSTPEDALDQPCDLTQTIVDCANSLADTNRPIASESGYSTAGNALVSDWVSQRAQATYTLRLLLHNFAAGIPRTYLYELIDLQSPATLRNHGYGLVTAKQGPNNTMRIGYPKLAYTALARLNGTIGNLGAASLPGQIDLSLTDPTTGATLPPEEIEHVVLRRQDGSFVLAVWQPEIAWKHANYRFSDLTVAPKAVQVGLDPSQGGWSAARFLPTTSDSPQEVWRNTSSFQFAVDDDVTLINLAPPEGLRGLVQPPDTAPESTIPETSIPGTTLPDLPGESLLPTAGPVDYAQLGTATPAGLTAPRTGAQHLAVASQRAVPAARLPARARAAVARERANRLARARSRAHRAYAACLDRQVAQARRRMRAKHVRPHLTRPTPRMRARCDQLLAR
jgi:hypothetical protein